MNVEVEIVIPKGADDPLDWMLVEITKAISAVDEERVSHGFLGGEHGYGAHWDSAEFMMHPFCWCEQDDCRWCSDEGCGCPSPDGDHYVDGVTVSSEEYWAKNNEIVAPYPSSAGEWGSPAYKAASAAFDASIKERDRRLEHVYAERKHTCEPVGMMADRPRGASYLPSQSAPNFWHKPSGLKVWWYKWIGRSQETLNVPDDLSPILRACLADIAALAMETR